METKKIVGLLAVIVIVVTIASFASFQGFVGNFNLITPGSVPSGNMISSDEQFGQEIEYGSMVCVYHNDKLVYCSPNTLTTGGKNMTRDRLINGPGAAVAYIAVGNGSAVAASSTSLDSEITAATGCTNLARASGSGPVAIATGNWSYSYKWTSDCGNIKVNTTGLFNASAGSGDVLFAGDTFSNPVTLSVNDQLNVTWYIFVTSTT